MEGNEIGKGTKPLAGPSASLNTQQPSNENMEVHHHPHVEKKNFKEYFLEFLMIFLAVTMGFLAENLREHFGDKEKEKQYMESFAADLQGDTSACTRSINNIFLQVHKIDTLENLLSSPGLKTSDSDIAKCYNLSWFIQNEYSLTFNERTINQLISSGNMRLLRKNVSDSVMDYFTALKDIETQKQFYINYTSKCIDLVSNYFEFKYMQTRVEKDTTLSLVSSAMGKPALLVTDAVQLGKFNTTIEYTKRIAYSYMADIIQVKKKAVRMLKFLHNEYD